MYLMPFRDRNCVNFDDFNWGQLSLTRVLGIPNRAKIPRSACIVAVTYDCMRITSNHLERRRLLKVTSSCSLNWQSRWVLPWVASWRLRVASGIAWDFSPLRGSQHYYPDWGHQIWFRRWSYFFYLHYSKMTLVEFMQNLAPKTMWEYNPMTTHHTTLDQRELIQYAAVWLKGDIGTSCYTFI